VDTELLKTFLEVQKTRHFGKAAENLYLTQSAVSFRIRQLEQNLGVALFNRHRNNIQLTEAGELLLPHAEAVISALQRARAQLQQQISLPQRLSISVEAGLQFLAADLLESLWVQGSTSVQLTVQDTNTAMQRHADLILTTQAHSEHQHYQIRVWRQLTLVAVGPLSEKIQAEGRLDWLGKLPQLSQAPLAFCCADPRLLRQWLGRNSGAAFLPQPMVLDLLQNGLYQLLDVPAQQFNLYLWTKQGSPVYLQPEGEQSSSA